MVEELRTHKMSEGDFEYIEDYETYITGVRNYDEKIRTEAQREAKREAQKEAQKEAQREAQREARLEKKHIIRNMRLKGFSVELIADISGLQTSDVYVFFKELDKEE